MKRLVICFLLCGLLCSSSNADITYTAVRSVGTGTVSLSITTDGTLGILGDSNLVDWTISMSEGGDSFTLLGPVSGPNSSSLTAGTALTATATDLFFDYDAIGTHFLLIQSPGIGSGMTFWSVQTGGSFDFSGPAEAIDPRFDFSYVRESHSGNLVIASVSGVPEPSLFGLLTVGGMAAGAVIRRRVKK